ncbi:lysine N(6)-hydroxylase/L-ornithine N(5)-oxygenase family protein [Kitasatospora aureofaciens]|uniref:lysine N(6)-hydroxylase/L-ornithine N(5)-oxygenase family protein n=1 Tax=Kitasatospora aureofaciens TaxID=1894 RepID=UPI0037C85E42
MAEHQHQAGSATVADVIGVGFGPANLALAIAAEELAETTDARGHEMHFLEAQPRFGWHRGMLIDGATMQVSFLKDLATMRNPTSRYSFVAYLHARGRLADFINGKTFYPFRTEFHDYLEWAAGHFGTSVSYGSEVVGISPVSVDGTVRHLDVTSRDGEGHTTTRRTRNVVIGAGLVPRLPAGVRSTERIWHSSELLDRLRHLPSTEPRSFAVVGAGQSAAEVVNHLHQRYPGAEVHAVFSRYGYSVADDSPFTNRIFDPVAVDHFFEAPDHLKDSLIRYHANTNYAVADVDLAEELYRTAYRETITGRRRLHIHNASRADLVEEARDGVQLDVEFMPDASVSRLRVDALVYATGYRPADPLPLLQELEAECKKDERGRLVLNRDYRVVTSDTVQCGIYMHGAGSEHSHGLSAGLLSNIAVRAGEITRSIAAQTC